MDVTPNFFVFNSVHERLTYSVLLCNIFPKTTGIKNTFSNIISNFAIASTGATRLIAPKTIVHISNIFFLRASIKVVWINACTIVAFVVYLQTNWNRANKSNIAVYMRGPMFFVEN